jgi:hypothetical protein
LIFIVSDSFSPAYFSGLLNAWERRISVKTEKSRLNKRKFELLLHGRQQTIVRCGKDKILFKNKKSL